MNKKTFFYVFLSFLLLIGCSKNTQISNINLFQEKYAKGETSQKLKIFCSEEKTYVMQVSINAEDIYIVINVEEERGFLELQDILGEPKKHEQFSINIEKQLLEMDSGIELDLKTLLLYNNVLENTDYDAPHMYWNNEVYFKNLRKGLLENYATDTMNESVDDMFRAEKFKKVDISAKIYKERYITSIVVQDSFELKERCY